MPNDPGNLHPRGGGVVGEIGIEGGLLKIRPEKIIPRIVNPLLESSRFVQRFPSFIASRLVYGSLALQGAYLDGTVKDALKLMVEGTVLTNVTLRLGGVYNRATDTFDNARGYTGTLVVRSAKPTWTAGDPNAQKTISYDIECQFSGTIDILGQSYSFTGSESGEILSDLRQGWTATIGYQDERQDSIRRPYIITGVDEATTDPYDALGLVVASLGGISHQYNGLSLLRGTARSGGYGIVVGTLEYGLGPWDCSPALPIISIGFVDDVSREEPGDVIGSESGGSVCDSIPITIIPNIKRRVPFRVYRWPGVWSTEPGPGPVGKINNASYTLPNGTVFPMAEVRWDSVDAVPTKAQGVSRYSGHVQLSQRDGGWIRGKIICVQSVPTPLEGDQTLPSYVLAYGFKQVYQYARVAFPTLAEFVPICYD